MVARRVHNEEKEFYNIGTWIDSDACGRFSKRDE